MVDHHALVRDVASQVNGFIAASVVDLDSGLPLATFNASPAFDLDVASAHNSEMVKGKFRTLAALGLSSRLEDMLLTLSDQLHLIKLIDERTFIYVAAEKNKTNLALLRLAVVLEFRAHGS